MRDKRLIVVHRGGPLTKDQHRKLIEWARRCSGHVLPLLGNNVNKRLIAALDIAQEWIEGKATVGDARKAIKYTGRSVLAERQWQIEQLSPEIKAF